MKVVQCLNIQQVIVTFLMVQLLTLNVLPPALCPLPVRMCRSMASVLLWMHAAQTGTTQSSYCVHCRWVGHVTVISHSCMGLCYIVLVASHGSHDLNNWITYCHVTSHMHTGGSPCSDPRGLHHPAWSLLEEDGH